MFSESGSLSGGVIRAWMTASQNRLNYLSITVIHPRPDAVYWKVPESAKVIRMLHFSLKQTDNGKCLCIFFLVIQTCDFSVM
jgi:hypothetical protein